MKKPPKRTQQTAESQKTFAMKVVETLEALQLLRDAVREVREGKTYHLAVLSGQMRSLLIDKSGQAERRLLYVAEKMNFPLNVFCMRGVDDPSYPLEEKPVFWLSGFPITAERQLEGQMELPLDKVLSQPFVHYEGVQYTARTIIEWFANKAGGSHYSGSMPRHFAEMLTLKVGFVDPLRQMLLQLGEATLVAGLKLIRAAVQQELHLVVVIPERPERDVYLLDAAYPDSPMRLSLMLDARGTPVVHLMGLDGSWIKLVGNRLVTWQSPRHLQLSIIITDELYTRAELHLDGQSLGSVELKAPLFLSPEWKDFDVWYNKSANGELQEFSFGLAEIVLVGAQLSPSDRANMLLYEERKRDDPNLKLVLYGLRGYGRAAPGERDIKMEGAVKWVEVKDVIPIRTVD